MKQTRCSYVQYARILMTCLSIGVPKYHFIFVFASGDHYCDPKTIFALIF